MTPGAFEGRVPRVLPFEAYDRLMHRIGSLPYADSNREVFKNIAFEFREGGRPVNTERVVEVTRGVLSRSRFIAPNEETGRPGSMDPTELVNYVHHSVLGGNMRNPPTDITYAGAPHPRINSASSAGVSI